jgi:hypothetical protein
MTWVHLITPGTEACHAHCLALRVAPLVIAACLEAAQGIAIAITASESSQKQRGSEPIGARPAPPDDAADILPGTAASTVHT